LPWTIFLIPALLTYRPYRNRFTDPVAQFLLLWFLTVFIFFSISDTKRELYLLPLVPTLALFVGKYFDDFASVKIAQAAVYQWLAMGFFAIVAIAGLGIPFIAWFMRRDAFVAILPASAVLVASGVAAVLFIPQRQPLKLVASVVCMMALTVVCASLWIMPYLESFKSPKMFARKVVSIVPSGASIFVYADTMNDFNYYMDRGVIPVLPTRKDVDALLARQQEWYLLVKDRDLKRLAQLHREWIVASDERFSASWYLVKVPDVSSQASVSQTAKS
jgi:4-amino-4-deoxy-L-arabinose transferase-like glycosyltransferase